MHRDDVGHFNERPSQRAYCRFKYRSVDMKNTKKKSEPNTKPHQTRERRRVTAAASHCAERLRWGGGSHPRIEIIAASGANHETSRIGRVHPTIAHTRRCGSTSERRPRERGNGAGGRVCRERSDDSTSDDPANRSRGPGILSRNRCWDLASARTPRLPWPQWWLERLG
jgi:hypothetical protein